MASGEQKLDKLPLTLRSLKLSEILIALFLVGCTLLFFYLDVYIGENISFYIFYFPFIAAMAWYFGKFTSWLMVILCFILWFIKQWDLGLQEFNITLVWNGLICMASFCAICWMSLAIREREENLRRKSQELEQFASNAAHELNSPTTNILGYTQLLQDRFQNNTDQQTINIAENIENNARRMTNLIKELLDYARAGYRDFSRGPVDLKKVVTETLESFSFEIAEKKARISVDPLPALSVESDLMGLLFQNLIGNALKYCEQEPRIHIAAVCRRKEWLFSVQDNGIGIPKEAQKRIFFMFEKAATPHKYPGTGIGLATCQKIISRYRGRLWVESPPKHTGHSTQRANNASAGKGSIFYFTLPNV